MYALPLKRTMSAPAFTLLMTLLAALVGAAPASAQTQAQQFQASSRMTSILWGPLSGMYHHIGWNEEHLWPPGSMPPGTPSSAISVGIQKVHEQRRWQVACEYVCVQSTVVVNIVIDFADGSKYVFRYWSRSLRCTNGDYDRSRYYSDQASGIGTHRIRSDYRRESRYGSRAEEVEVHRFAAWLAPENGTLTLSDDAQALVEGLDTIEVRTGPGGMLDLQDVDPTTPLLVTAQPVSIYTDEILLADGVFLSDLFSPVPVVFPGENYEEVDIALADYDCALGSGERVIQVRVTNRSNIAEIVTVSWLDELDWVTPGGTDLPLEPGETSLMEINVLIPEAAGVCDIDIVTVSGKYGDDRTTEFAFGISSDVDFDGDGVPNSCDGCWNDNDPDQDDADDDGTGDICDNCRDTFNPWQGDQDDDGIGDACEATIPTVSEWGLIAMALLVMTAGTLVFRSRAGSPRPS